MSSSSEIFVVTFRIASGASKIPPPMIGAWVTAFTRAEDVERAVKAAAATLRGMGFEIKELSPTARTLPVANWDAFIVENFREFKDRFPSQADIEQVLDQKDVIFSPFAGFEKEPKA